MKANESLATHEIIDAFRDAMRSAGVNYTGSIEADAKLHRFDVEGDRRGSRTGFYILFPDGLPAGNFGCWKRGINENWCAKSDKAMTADDRKAYQERLDQIKAQRAADERARHDKAAAEANQLWNSAEPANDNHPYLVRKGIKAHGLKVGRWTRANEDTGEIWVDIPDALLVPLKLDGQIKTLQGIFPSKDNPLKRDKDFLPGGMKRGLYHGIGHKPSTEPGYPVVIVEGFATGASIHEATGYTVIIAFDAGNLLPVAEKIRAARPKAKIIIAADNDQWTLQPVENPGVHYARIAARHVNGIAVVPQFSQENIDAYEQQSGGKPTDWNDLAAIEGHQAIVSQFDEQLNPKPAASVPANDNDASETAVEQEVSEGDFYSNKHFRCLGYDRDCYYFFQYDRRQVRKMTRSDMNTNGLLELAPEQFWKDECGGEFKKTTIVDSLIRALYSAGIYDPSKTRGRGAWMDDGRTVFHFGDKLWVDGTIFSVNGIKSRFVYEMDRSLMSGPISGTGFTLNDDDGRDLVELAKMFRWTKPASAALLAGFVALAPFCGALRWRPHIWITGGAGCGKTTVLNEYVHRLMAGVDVFAQGNSTEAGIRQTLLSDALPVLMDESEQNNDREQSRVQNVISLIRQASSESAAMTLKGTAHGHSMHFLVRSMFCLSSIQVGLKHQADNERLTILALRPKREDIDSADTWNKLKAALHKLERDQTLPQRLFWRSLTLMPITLRNITVFVDAASKKFNSVREGDQYGTLLAGCWSMMSSELVTPEQAAAMIDSYDWDEYRENNDMDESNKALISLMESRIRLTRGGEASVMEVVRCAKFGPQGSSVDLAIAEADQILQRYGMRVFGNDLLLSNSSTALLDLFKNTPYQADWRNLILRVAGVKRHQSTVRINNSACKCVAVPLDIFEFPNDPDYVPF